VTRFLDGPAVGVTLTLRRSPLYLRVTRHVITHKWDALDQLADSPSELESVTVYRREGDTGSVHLDYTDRHGRRRGANHTTADYRLCETQPDDATARNPVAWRQWCQEQAKQSQESK
jgi:hypothetical protein